MIRKGDPNMLLALSPSDGTSYFIAIGDVAEWVYDSPRFRSTLELANATDSVLANLDTIHISQSKPSSRRSSMARSSRESLR